MKKIYLLLIISIPIIGLGLWMIIGGLGIFFARHGRPNNTVGLCLFFIGLPFLGTGLFVLITNFKKALRETGFHNN